MLIRSIQMDINKNPKINIEKAIELSQSDSLSQVDLLIFPEMFTTGYQLDKIDTLAHQKDDPIFELFSGLAKRNNINILLGSIAYKTDKGVSNTSFVFNRNGDIISEYSKLHLFKLMKEEQYLVPGDSYHFFDLDGITCSSIICYDLRFPELTRKLFSERQPELLLVPMEWPAPRTNAFKTLLQARAIENQCYVVSSNRIGEENGSVFEGYSLAADPFGNILQELPFREGILDIKLDFSVTENVRSHMTCFEDRRLDMF